MFNKNIDFIFVDFLNLDNFLIILSIFLSLFIIINFNSF